MNISVSTNYKNYTPKFLTEEDVWGVFNKDRTRRISNGMIIAREDEICPIWSDKVEWRSDTILCRKEHLEDVLYWTDFMNGADNVIKQTDVGENHVAIRTMYMC